jgi:hypothetical protein
MSLPPSFSASRRRGVQVLPHDRWTLQQCRVDQQQMVHGDPATVVSPPRGQGRTADRALMSIRSCRSCQTSWRGGRTPPGGGFVQPAGMGGRAQAGPTACTPSGQRAFPASAHTGCSGPLADYGPRGVRRRRRPGPSRGDGTARARLEAPTGRASLLPRARHQAIFGDRRSGRSASCCSRRSGLPARMS